MSSSQRTVAALSVGLCLLCAARARGAVLFSDSFSYPDGVLAGAPGSPWTNFAGTANQVNVLSNQVQLTQSESEDVSAPLAGAPYSSGTLYAGIDFNFSSLPTLNGGYFFHFKDATATGHRGRVWATIQDAAVGSFRIGVTNGSNTGIVTFPQDLSLNTAHRLILKYDGAAAASTLYLDAVSETGGVAATDLVTGLSLTSIGLRQSVVSGSGMGTLLADNLIVGESFADVVPEPASLAFVAIGLLAARRLGITGR